MRRCFPAAARPGPFRTGEMGGLATKLGFYFGIGRKVARFFTPSAQVVGFWRGTAERAWPRIGVDFGRFRSSFRRFCCALGEGGRQWTCARVASGVGRRKKVHPTAHALWDAPKKGSWGGNPSKTCPQLVGEWVTLSAWAEGGGGFRCAAAANRCRTARKWSSVVDFWSEKGEG